MGAPFLARSLREKWGFCLPPKLLSFATQAGVIPKPRLHQRCEDLAWRTVAGVPMSQIVITRQQAEELVAEIERLRATHK